jgi:hypothetical protein
MHDQPRSGRTIWSRILSLEGALAAFGLYSLGSGLWHGTLLPIFWGVTIIAGLGILLLVRRRDWSKHWAAMDSRPAPPDNRDDTGPPS